MESMEAAVLMDRKELLVEPCARPLSQRAVPAAAAAARARPKHTAARIHQPEERSPPDAMTSNTNVIVLRSLSPAPGKLRENKLSQTSQRARLRAL
ncbi:hypothetical protein DPX16_23622 [Anabarilius grahami]|uniref:Uncharacterized protein n=1 Tax=Anabarilius grahami TaxID=495550 RepID=A0A3N0ZAZ8_ANAGA|nr:hypothetical protein DPX16_23622 [Anabarilius grahami]